jgi:hypothetical protein
MDCVLPTATDGQKPCFDKEDVYTALQFKSRLSVFDPYVQKSEHVSKDILCSQGLLPKVGCAPSGKNAPVNLGFY